MSAGPLCPNRCVLTVVILLSKRIALVADAAHSARLQIVTDSQTKKKPAAASRDSAPRRAATPRHRADTRACNNMRLAPLAALWVLATVTARVKHDWLCVEAVCFYHTPKTGGDSFKNLIRTARSISNGLRSGATSGAPGPRPAATTRPTSCSSASRGRTSFRSTSSAATPRGAGRRRTIHRSRGR